MGRLRKPELLHVVENSIRAGGWNFLLIPPAGRHPARYQIYRDNHSFRAKIYIWNLTPGGKNRSLDEWRIQITGVASFEPEIGGKTLILGWQDDMRVFAGFDYAHHMGQLGSSPSIQLREAALYDAVKHRFAPHNKGNGELAIAFRPDVLASYIENLESLHQCGKAAEEIDVLRQLGKDPNQVADEDIGKEIAEPRRFAVISTKRALREIDFRDRVLTAYGHRCAMCGVQLELLDGAHVLPVAHNDSTDGTDNGVSLCALHHRAYDRALLTFDPDYRVHFNDDTIAELKAGDRAHGLASFRKAVLPILSLLPDKRDRPARNFVMAANSLRGWDL